MRSFARCSLFVLVALVTAGPVLSASVVVSGGPTIGAPAAPGHTPFATALQVLGGVVAFGAIRIKDTGSLAKKFVQRASAAAGEYTSGVQQAAGDWETNTKAAEENYRTGVTTAAAEGRFGRGVAAAGGQKYLQRATTLGAQRYPTGVGAAEGDWAKGTQPYLDALKGMTLSPRRPKGDPGNMTRANEVAQRLRAMRVGK